MKKYEVTRKVGDNIHVTTISAGSKLQAIQMVQKTDEYNYPCKRWNLIECEDMDDERVVE